MDLQDAITRIHLIQTQMARTERLRGLGALPVAFSGLLALLAGAAQAVWIPAPAEEPGSYLLLWAGAAILGTATAAAALWAKCLLLRSPLVRATALLAIELFAPALAAGAAVTVLLPWRAPDSLWLLPGLWQIVFSLGVLATWRLLPRGVLLVGLFYLLSGSTCLALGEASLSPWAMAVPFTCGQLAMAAAILGSTGPGHREEVGHGS